jgi:hypothetical protein
MTNMTQSSSSVYSTKNTKKDLIKLTLCPTSHHLSPKHTESFVSPPACTNHDATGLPNLLLLCKGDGSTVGQEGFRLKVKRQSAANSHPHLPTSLMVIYQQIPKDKPGGSPVKGYKSWVPILLCPTGKASPGLAHNSDVAQKAVCTEQNEMVL